MRRMFKVFVAIVVFASSLLTFNKGSEAKTTEPSFTKENKKSFVLYHAKDIQSKKEGYLQLAWHWSHSSHESHWSHYSHYSGY